ncbi:DUF58 domain-containing protein [Nocardioides sp. ChNu-153]|uniref:DUF58 domain-containing protein n=1 Tax=unclassified Nocardioides TaxID=2615069 RepID=UPI002404BA75|nr:MULTISPECIES: DUF58 domain-containing protein [unclassified Nocardioides]MDF9718104.1 DUF58 domain-containing protein [Nocardioides sp. ChNu-99]MDN7122841.1 DUF58 domain-containing protein [Nocardioides sp. ChNu-153]
MARPAPAAWRALTPRGRGTALLAVVVLVVGVVARYPVLAGLGACLLALVVVELAAVLRRHALALRRTVEPAVVVRHEPCHGTLRVAGRRRRGLVRTEAVDTVDGVLHPVRIPDTDRAEEVRVEYPVPTRRRGVVPVGPLLLRHHGLLGLASHGTEHGEVTSVRVLPRRVPLSRTAPGTRRAVVGATEAVDVGGTDLVGLHEYSAGDDLRRLHWATSARSGTLMVREDAEPAEPHVCVLLDDRSNSYPADDRDDLFEDAVELASALCRVTVAAGQPLRFRVVSGRYAVDVPASPARLPRPEGDEVELLLAEIGAVGPDTAPVDVRGVRDADVAVAVSGARADDRELALLLGDGARRVVLSLDPRPLVSSGQVGDVLVLRGGGALGLAAQWDVAVGA